MGAFCGSAGFNGSLWFCAGVPDWCSAGEADPDELRLWVCGRRSPASERYGQNRAWFWCNQRLAGVWWWSAQGYGPQPVMGAERCCRNWSGTCGSVRTGSRATKTPVWTRPRTLHCHGSWNLLRIWPDVVGFFSLQIWESRRLHEEEDWKAAM